METSIGKAVIVVSGASPELTEIGKIIEAELKRRKVAVDRRFARETLIPNLAPGNFFIFGALPEENLETGEYCELFRSLQGVNFAGRRGAFFTTDGTKALIGLKAMVKDSDLAVLEPGLSPSGKGDLPKTVSRWVDGLLTDMKRA